jgi:uncharacterized protein (TIGR02466 family)
MSFQILPVFAVPFALSRHPHPQAMNRELAQLFLAREAEGGPYANPNATMRITSGLFESRFDLFKWPEACVRNLREFCWSQLYRLVGELNGYDAKTLSMLTGHADAWFHVTRAGGYFGIHNHPMASWSGVYCVDPGSDRAEDGGKLNFPHPSGAAAMYVDPAVHNLQLPYSHKGRDFQLEAGQLVLFPSWLPHQVLPYIGTGTRITVAFNAWFSSN